MESMPIARYQISIPSANNVPEDTVTNTWHFTQTAIDETVTNLVQTELVAFYEALDGFKSPLMAWQNARMKVFNLDDSPPRVPVYDELFGATSTAQTSALPREVSACLSFHGDYVSGFPQSRRRGRIYFGPLSSPVIQGTTGKLTTTLCNAMATAGGDLLTASNSASDWAWVVYSQVGSTAYPVVDGWVDDEPDIQRRRGSKYVVRTAFS